MPPLYLGPSKGQSVLAVRILGQRADRREYPMLDQVLFLGAVLHHQALRARQVLVVPDDPGKDQKP
jgi:hypothetical protein